MLEVGGSMPMQVRTLEGQGLIKNTGPPLRSWHRKFIWEEKRFDA